MGGCDEPCDDCSRSCSAAATPASTGSSSTDEKKPGLIDIEDYEAELARLHQRTKELEDAMANILIDNATATTSEPKKLRSADWFNRKTDLGMTALYIERYLNMGFSRDELMSGKPIIGIAQSGSDIAPVSFSLVSENNKWKKKIGHIC